MIFGAAYDETLGDQLRVTVIATGLSQRRPQVAALTVVQPTTGQRTGTDNLPILDKVLSAAQPGEIGNGAKGQADYSNISTPSVWRSARTQAAAKVEALSTIGYAKHLVPMLIPLATFAAHAASRCPTASPPGSAPLSRQTWPAIPRPTRCARG